MNANEIQDEKSQKSWWQMVKSCSGTALDRRNQYVFISWLFIWSLGFVAAAWALKHADGLSDAARWLIAAAPNVAGIGALLAYMRFLRMTDELVRKIQLEGLAIGFGAGAIFALGYQLLQQAGAPQLDISDLAVVMMVGWSAGQILGMRRYR